MTDKLYIAIDLGAGSGRVFLGGFGENEFLLEEMHRFQYPPKSEKGHLRWDFTSIFDNLKQGLRYATERATVLNRQIISLGVDSWGVDYGLIDEAGNLIENPICYRDKRTDHGLGKVFEKISKDDIFEKTGIQFLQFNTIFQLAVTDYFPNQARLLLIPDLVNFCCCLGLASGKGFAFDD